MKKHRVLVWGLGNMGSGMAKLMLKKSAVFELVGGIDLREAPESNDLGDFLGLGEKLNIPYTNQPETLIQPGKADLVLLNIHSFTEKVFNEVKMIAEAGINCITIAEEMAYPWAQKRDLAKQLEAIAEKNQVTILGTGVNPGFVLDTLAITLTGACLEVERIEASRINDLSPFGKTVMETQGVGTTPEEFQKGLEDGTIVGHIGFPESIHMIFEALGWEFGRIEETRAPILSNTERETSCVQVQPGMVAGCRHTAVGYDKDGVERVKLIHPQQIHPEKEDIETGDYINIYGDPEIAMAIKPEIGGGKGTIAMAVNMIPHVINAQPGMLAMIDLPGPRAIMKK